MKIFSIVGTDTEIGKTYTTVEILNYLNHKNLKAFALKPISAGLDNINGELINQDVANIAAANYSAVPQDLISPLQFKLAIAPHIAAKYQDIDLNTHIIIDKIQQSLKTIKVNANYVLIEGVGGVMVPLNETETYINVLQKLNQPVILVVGMKLGCLNHALLTYSALINNNIKVAGWVANCIIDNMPYFSDNLEYLKQVLNVPLIAVVPHNRKMETTPIFKEIFGV